MSQNVESPDWLPENPTSPEAHQMVLERCDGDSQQASMAAYMGGYFEGEGCIRVRVGQSDTSRTGHKYEPVIYVGTAQQMAGFTDAEGSIKLDVRSSETHNIGYALQPVINAKQVESGTILEEIFESYCSLFDVEFNTNRHPARREREQPTVSARVLGEEDIKNFLTPVLPLLREKRRQAVIMLREILPRYGEGVHHTKEGFIELMRWKRELDREKPMSDEGRKYTVEYFEDLWRDEIEQQGRISEFAGGGSE